MFDLFMTEAYFPFTVSLALLFALLALELVLGLIGGTLLGLGADPDVDFDVEVPEIGDFSIDVDAADLVDVEIADIDADFDVGDVSASNAGPVSWLGVGKVPFMIWLTSLLLGFGLSGLVLQQVFSAFFGWVLPVWFAVLPAIFIGLWFTNLFSAAFARLLPKTETTAVSSRHLGRRTGTVTQGTAKRGKPAEVRVSDRFGNIHYLRGEPLQDDQSIPAGSQVLVLRHLRGEGYRLVSLGHDA